MKRASLRLATVACLLAAPSASRASDHLDGTKTSADPSADLTDVYAFTSPADSSKAVLIMDVHPLAFSSTQFSDAVTYSFRVRPVDSSTMLASTDASQETRIVCTFAAGTAAAPSQQATCKLQAPGGATTETATFATRGGSYKAGGDGSSASMHVFAGVRSDPYATDTARVGAYYKLQPAPTGATKNALKGFNVLSIVVEIPKAKLPGPIFAVAAQTVRS